jgi:hypothetical protein
LDFVSDFGFYFRNPFWHLANQHRIWKRSRSLTGKGILLIDCTAILSLLLYQLELLWLRYRVGGEVLKTEAGNQFSA